MLRRTKAAIAMLLMAVFATAQSPDPERTPKEIESSVTPVKIDAQESDEDIEARLGEILGAIEGASDIDIDVRHGVARLEGEVTDEDELRWIAALVLKTEGVVAVQNRLSVRQGSIWDFSPALAELESLWRDFVGSLPRMAGGLLLLLLLALLGRPLTRWIARPLERRFETELMKTVMRKLTLIVYWLAVLYVFLRVSGLTQIAVTIVGGTGVLGIVLGFAFRDIAENFLASVLISVQRPFRYGDTIEVDGMLGVVQRVTPRGTILMDFEGNYLQIANAQVYKSPIKNYTANPKVRDDFMFGIGYDASISHCQEVVMGALESHEAVLDDPRPMVLAEELASATINLRVYYWIDGSKHSKNKVRSALVRIVRRVLEDAGISMPDDAREVLFPQGVPVRLLEQGEPHPAPPAPETTPASDAAARRDATVAATDAEGSLETEAEDIEQQVRASRQPEPGADVMAPK